MSSQSLDPLLVDMERSVQLLREQGWCVIADVVPETDVDAIRATVIDEEQRQTAVREGWVRTSIGSPDLSRNQKLSKAENIIPKIGQRSSFLLDPRYMGVLRSVLGGYVRVTSDFGIVTFPGNEREFWHADWPHNQTVAAHIPEPYGTTLMHLGSLVMLTDFTIDNGGTIVLPGSHLFERNPTGAGDETYAGAEHYAEQQVTGKAGSILIYDSRLWHSIAPNRTARPRVALAIRFAPWWLNLEVRRPGSIQAKSIENMAVGRPTPVPTLSRLEYEALPPAVRPLYEHWIDGNRDLPLPRASLTSSGLPPSQDTVLDPAPVDDSLLFDLRHLQYALPMTQLAIDFGLFQFLERQSAGLAAITQFLGCTTRAAEAMLAVEASLGLLEALEDGRYCLSEEARTYLLPASPFYRAVLLGDSDQMLQRLKIAFRPDHDAISPLAGETERLDEGELSDFVERMDALARPVAISLAKNSLWSTTRRLLDVGGGAGAFCIAIAQRHPEISCTLLERGPVCRIAAEQVARSGLSGRIKMFDRNMLSDPFPKGHDAILFSNIFHNWDAQTCLLLAKKAFESLDPRGVLVLHEVLLHERKDGPLGAACFSVAMLLSHRGKQYTYDELRDIVVQAGFQDCRAEPTLGRYHIVYATKPSLS